MSAAVFVAGLLCANLPGECRTPRAVLDAVFCISFVPALLPNDQTLRSSTSMAFCFAGPLQTSIRNSNNLDNSLCHKLDNFPKIEKDGRCPISMNPGLTARDVLHMKLENVQRKGAKMRRRQKTEPKISAGHRFILMPESVLICEICAGFCLLTSPLCAFALKTADET